MIRETDSLFENQKIDWKLVQDSVYRRKKEGTALKPDEVIEDMIDLVRQIEKIV